MKENLLKLIVLIEKNKYDAVDYINLILNEISDTYIIDIFEEIKSNILKNKKGYLYIGLIEIIEYLGLDEELYIIYMDYLNFIDIV